MQWQTMSTEDALLLLKTPFGYICSHINISFHFVNSLILSKSSPWAFPTLLQYSGHNRSDIFIFLLSTTKFLTSQSYSTSLHVLCSSLVLTCATFHLCATSVFLQAAAWMSISIWFLHRQRYLLQCCVSAAAMLWLQILSLCYIGENNAPACLFFFKQITIILGDA